MELLLNPTEFASYRDIGKKLDTAKINECIKLAQSVDLFDVMGDFYFDLLENKTNEDYENLFSGSTFIIDGKNFIQEGIKSLLADYTYARFIYKINTNITPFGATTKLSDNSEPIDRNLLKDLTKQTMIDADVKFRIIDKYLKANSTTFPRYRSGNNPNITTYSQRFTVVKK
ncbi:MAG: hypothetical protein Q8O62_04450 [Aequorivita sp.]|nr:hypothetical protein [Aequorivita sp.]